MYAQTPNTLVHIDQLTSSKTPDKDPIPKFEVVESQVQIAERIAKEEQDRKDAEEQARKQQEEEQAHEEFLRQKKLLKRQSGALPNGYYPYECVFYVQRLYPGIHTRNGWARTFPINSRVPQIGGVVVLEEGPWGHVALVSDILQGKIVLSEANYVYHRITNGRTVPLNSSDIKGYYQ